MYPMSFLRPDKCMPIFRRLKATVVNGKLIANSILLELENAVKEFEIQYNHVPTLAAILVGENSASELYVKNKVTAANLVGIKINVLRLDPAMSESLLAREIIKLNNDREVNAILLQLPLPEHINMNIYNLIAAEKDVDGFTSTNFGKFCLGLPAFVPCTALAVRKIIQHIGEDISGKNAVVCGRSKHVGLPIAMMLHSNFQNTGFNANTVICHRFTPPNKLIEYCQNADVLVSATGNPSFIRGHMIKKGAIVIDVGISRIVDSNSSKVKLCGDVNFEEVSEIASFITPVPGGVGPLTVAMLLKNTFLAAQQQRSK